MVTWFGLELDRFVDITNLPSNAKRNYGEYRFFCTGKFTGNNFCEWNVSAQIAADGLPARNVRIYEFRWKVQ